VCHQRSGLRKHWISVGSFNLQRFTSFPIAEGRKHLLGSFRIIFPRRFVATVQEVLPEQIVTGKPPVLTGYTGQFLKVVFPGLERLIGNISSVYIARCCDDGLAGNLL